MSSSVRIVVQDPQVVQPSTPGQADGIVRVPIDFQNLSHADEAVAIFANLKGVKGMSFTDELAMALTLYLDSRRAQ